MLDEKCTYNKKAYFKKNIYPIMQQLIKECYYAKIPVFFSAAVANTDTSTVYISESVSDTDVEFRLSDDKISDFIKILRGGRVLLASESDEIDFDDFNIASFEVEEPYKGTSTNDNIE